MKTAPSFPRRLVLIAVLTGLVALLVYTQLPARHSSATTTGDAPGTVLLSYRHAAEAGDNEAALRLGAMLEKGLATKTDIVEAVHWYQQAANRGFAPAQFKLGVLAHTGTGQPVDYATALQWFTQAATQGHDGARYYLGLMYLKGEGVPSDPVQAYRWFYPTHQQGHPKSWQALETALAAMSTEQRAEVKAALPLLTPSTAAAPEVP